MQLGKLSVAIRKAPVVMVRFSFGEVALQKTSLLNALHHHFDRRTVETGLYLTDDNFLTWDFEDLTQ